jgi:hypothetical protein
MGRPNLITIFAYKLLKPIAHILHQNPCLQLLDITLVTTDCSMHRVASYLTGTVVFTYGRPVRSCPQLSNVECFVHIELRKDAQQRRSSVRFSAKKANEGWESAYF